MVSKTNIRSLTLSGLEEFFTSNGQQKYRGRQVHEWLWKKSCRSFEEMSNLSKATRTFLDEHFSFPVTTIETSVQGSDKTIKYTFLTHDDLVVEGVLIPSQGRVTACISSQVGCALACSFCATGQMKFRRNLDFSEIFDQVTLLRDQSLKMFGKGLSNIVYMGMGEPLLNYENVVASIDKICDPEGPGMSPQRITISSVGIADQIIRMADDKPKFQFALSLHSANNETRSRIIPVNKKYPLPELVKALKYYHKATGKRITIEYILFRGFNDSLNDAAELAVFSKNFPVKINLIEYNPVEGSGFYSPEEKAVKSFQEFLEKKNLVVNLRKSRGKDIAAACGQLAGSHQI
jgi:23S rRNA (adenine2503-C2)-methyltransferase